MALSRSGATTVAVLLAMGPASGAHARPSCLLLSDPANDATVSLQPRDDGSIGAGTVPNSPSLDIRRVYVRTDARHIVATVAVSDLESSPVDPAAFFVYLDVGARRVTFVAERTIDGTERAWFSPNDTAWGEYPAALVFDRVANEVTVTVAKSLLPVRLPAGTRVGNPSVVSMRPVGARGSTSYARTYLAADDSAGKGSVRVGPRYC